MKLSDIRPARGAVKKRKRVACGPGSGHGKTATRGHKGQNSRSGGGTPPWFEGGQMPLQRRVPKRGFTNIFKATYQIVNVDGLNRFEKGTKVDGDALHGAGLVRKADRPIKILGRGELKVSLEIAVDAVSRSAVKAIEDAGGSVQLLSGAKLPAAAVKTVEEKTAAPAEATEKAPPAPTDTTDENPTASAGEPADTSEEDRAE